MGCINRKNKAPSIIRKALRENVRSIKKLCELTILKPSGLWQVCKNNEIILPKNIVPYRTRPEIDRQIDRGVHLKDIANGECSGQSILNYVQSSGQHGRWLKNVEKAEERNKGNRTKRSLQQQDHKNYLIGKAIYEAEELGKHYERALEYVLGLHYTKYPWNLIVNVYKIYYDAIDKEEKISLEKIADICNSRKYSSKAATLPWILDTADKGRSLSLEENIADKTTKYSFYASSIARFFKTVGLKPMHGSVKREVIPLYKKEALSRTIDLDMPSHDIAYFLEIPTWFSRRYFRKAGKKSIPIDPFMRRNSINYGIISEIYKATDKGTKRKSTTNYFGIKSKVYDYVLKNRNLIEPKIINCLKVLYPDKYVSKPYL